MKPRRSASLQREPIQWEAVSEFLQFSLYLNVTSGSAYTSFHDLRSALGRIRSRQLFRARRVLSDAASVS